MRFILALVLLPAWTGAVAAEPMILGETPLGSDRCKVTATAKTAASGEPLKKSEWHASEWRCGGYQGRFVYLAYDDEREGLAFGSAKSASTDYMWPEGFGAWGPSIEWRGPEGASKQMPLAAIARYSWNIRSGASGNEPPNVGAALAVINVGVGPTDTCVVAWVDTAANPDAVALARKRADQALTQNPCTEGGKPERLGKLKPEG